MGGDIHNQGCDEYALSERSAADIYSHYFLSKKETTV